MLENDFLGYDRDGDGTTSLSEFRRAGRHRSMARGRVDECFRAADVDRSGVLDFVEYLEAAAALASVYYE